MNRSRFRFYEPQRNPSAGGFLYATRFWVGRRGRTSNRALPRPRRRRDKKPRTLGSMTALLACSPPEESPSRRSRNQTCRAPRRSAWGPNAVRPYNPRSSPDRPRRPGRQTCAARPPRRLPRVEGSRPVPEGVRTLVARPESVGQVSGDGAFHLRFSITDSRFQGLGARATFPDSPPGVMPTLGNRRHTKAIQNDKFKIQDGNREMKLADPRFKMGIAN